MEVQERSSTRIHHRPDTKAKSLRLLGSHVKLVRLQTTVSEPLVGVSPLVAGMESLVSRIEPSVGRLLPLPLPFAPFVGLPLALSSAGKLVWPRSL